MSIDASVSANVMIGFNGFNDAGDGWGRTRQNEPPLPLTSLIGRERELQTIEEALRRSRLVTIIGPGGVGKTRLATELGRRQAGRRAEGAWMVDLTAGPSSPEVAAETARVLGLKGSRGTSATEALSQYLCRSRPADPAR